MRIGATQKITKALVVASKEIGLEVYAEETKYNEHVSKSEGRTKQQHKEIL